MSCATPACNKALAYRMALAAFHSVTQADCLVSIINDHEDGAWLTEVPGQSVNASWGLPQADPGTKMAAAGPRWMSDARTQLRWMIAYLGGTPVPGVAAHWPSPCVALANENAASWY